MIFAKKRVAALRSSVCISLGA